VKRVLAWFRRDLRDTDNAALGAALSAALPDSGAVYCTFVFDTAILDGLRNRTDRRLAFIHASLRELDANLRRRGGCLIVRHGDARDEIPRLARHLEVDAVFAGRDYEPVAKQRDAEVERRLATSGCAFQVIRDQAIFDGSQVLTQAGKPYTVFTPYRNAWLRRLHDAGLQCHESHTGPLASPDCPCAIPALEDIGFADCTLSITPGMSGADRKSVV
jgi:deoxyribodipyrimidine photo-lyase